MIIEFFDIIMYEILNYTNQALNSGYLELIFIVMLVLFVLLYIKASKKAAKMDKGKIKDADKLL